MKKQIMIFRWLNIFLIMLASIFVFVNFNAYAYDTILVQRLSGADRYKTAVAISREGWKESEYIVLSVGEGDTNFADAIAGTTLSYALNAPVLFTPTAELSQDTRNEILRLNAKKVVILGGTEAISIDVENRLKGMGLTAERLWGPDRYGTSVKIAESVMSVQPSARIFLTASEEFQYPMMIAPFASRNGMPILYTEKDSLNKGVEEALARWGIQEVDIIGNTGVISQAVEDRLKSLGIRTNRVQGSDISRTNINIINTYGMGTGKMAVARDDIFVDSLAGAAFAAAKDMPLILTGKDSANPAISDFLSKLSLECAYIFGGPGAVSDYVIPAIRKGKNEPVNTGNTLGNINCGGIVSGNDGWIYYRSAGQGGKLYKVKSDGTGKEEVCSDAPMDINILGNWIYYINLSDSCRIYKIKADGTCRVKLNNDESWDMTIIDNWIYYINKSDGRHIYKIAADGSLRTKLNDQNCGSMNVKWDWIYYVNNDDYGEVCRLKQDNPSIIQKLRGVYAGSINVGDGCIYFSNRKDNRSLYKINTDGTGLSRLGSDAAFDIQAAGDTVYYSNASDGGKLYKIKTDGKDRKALYDGSCYLLNIADGWIYFTKDQAGLMLYKVRTDGTLLSQVDAAGTAGGIWGYIQSTREAGAGVPPEIEEKIEWVEITPEVQVGIPVRDAFKNDGKKVAFLTFDDGPSKTVTPSILDTLKKYDIKATFFIVGMMAKNNGTIIKRILSEGHTIANHGYSHEYSYIYKNSTNFLQEVNWCESVLKGILGSDFTTNIFRFPGGAFGNSYSAYKDLLNKQGYEYVNWTTSSGDSAANGVPAGKLLENVKQTSKGKDHIVVLMHDLGTKSTTAQALPLIIEYLKSQGYEFRKLI